MNPVYLGQIIRSWEVVVWGVFLLAACFAYFRRSGLLALSITAFALRVALPTTYSVLQYLAWSGEGKGLTQLLLPPHQPISYFLGYIWTAFFAKQVLALAAAAAVYAIARGVQTYRQGILNQRESLLLAAAALILGWPGVMFLLPLVIMLTALSATYKALRKQDTHTPIEPWILAATLIILVFGREIVRILDVQVMLIGR